MLGTLRKSSDHAAALERVRGWTQARFSLPDDAAILVSQLDCVIPGCPPVETVVAFWTGDAVRHHFKVFKPVADVVPDDLPFAWLKDALAVSPDYECECC